MLTELATSTYRLLDPRKRSRAYERIQLSVFSEDELELQMKSRRPLLATEPFAAQMAGGDAAHPVAESAVALRSSRATWSIPAGDGSADGSRTGIH